MKVTKQLNIEDKSCYCFSDMTNIFDFDSGLLSIDKVALCMILNISKI